MTNYSGCKCQCERFPRIKIKTILLSSHFWTCLIKTDFIFQAIYNFVRERERTGLTEEKLSWDKSQNALWTYSWHIQGKQEHKLLSEDADDEGLIKSVEVMLRYAILK
ncbi:hypothetical protein CHUAL_004530 [Chamberlinius hualienensis]